MKTAIPAAVFMVGLALICIFFVPIIDYQRGGIFHSNILTHYNVVASRLLAYVFMWALFCIAIYFFYKNPWQEKS